MTKETPATEPMSTSDLIEITNKASEVMSNRDDINGDGNFVIKHFKAIASRLSLLQSENKKLKTALINWGQHKHYCPKHDSLDEMAKCACGYDKCLKEFGAYYD